MDRPRLLCFPPPVAARGVVARLAPGLGGPPTKGAEFSLLARCNGMAFGSGSIPLALSLSVCLLPSILRLVAVSYSSDRPTELKL